ncbi:hypothetical protein [Prescottella equi]
MMIKTNEEEARVGKVIATVQRLAMDETLVPETVIECRSLADLRVVWEAEAAALPTDPRTGRFTTAADARLWRALDCGGTSRIGWSRGRGSIRSDAGGVGWSVSLMVLARRCFGPHTFSGVGAVLVCDLG